MKHILEANKLHMELDMNIFETDIKYSSNTIMSTTLKCNEFSAQTSMDIDIKEFAVFAEKIFAMYEKLNGAEKQMFAQESYDKLPKELKEKKSAREISQMSELDISKYIDSALERYFKAREKKSVKIEGEKKDV